MSEETRNWPELAIGLYDKITGRNAETTYQFENIEVMVPSSASADAAFVAFDLALPPAGARIDADSDARRGGGSARQSLRG